MTVVTPMTASRRSVLRGAGALVISFSIAPCLLAQQSPPPTLALPARPLPGSLRNTPMLDSWIRITADGAIIVFTGKSELGQGIKTSLLQIAAEQLAVAPGAITLVTSDTAYTPAEGYTSGSQSLQDSGTAIWHAAAQAREILVGLAAERLALPASALKVEAGAVSAADGRRVTYGDLVSDITLHVQAQLESKLRPPETFTIVGQSLPRVDIPAKVTGEAIYVHDLRLPGMIHARIVMPPGYGAKLAAVDTTSVAAMPGVRKIVRDDDFLAVTADREFRAVKAMEALAAKAQWRESETMPIQQELYAWLKRQPTRTITIRDDRAAGESPVRVLRAEYLRPFQMHASIGPSCAVAQFKDGKLTVWSHAQGMFPLRQAIAELVGLPESDVRCVHMEGAGCYGHNGADDAAADAAFLAMDDPGTPIRVQWTRHQEHQWEPYGSAMAMEVSAGLDANGNIVAWNYGVWSDTHSTRPGGAGATLVGQHVAAPYPVPTPQPGSQPAGFGDRNVIPLYEIPNLHLLYHFVPHQALRVSALRGLGAYANVFAIESFMDELALAAGQDPVEFRLRHLRDERARDVVRMAASRFRWQPDRAAPRGRGYGFGFARYKNLAAYCAVAIELAVEHETGRIRLLRAVAASDSGQAVNPDGIRNQIEGGIIQSASWTLHEDVDFDRARIRSRDWSSYPILRFGEMFEEVTVHVIDRPGLPFLGTGEASQGPAAAAIANAVAHATGQRIRELPLTAERVKAAIGV